MTKGFFRLWAKGTKEYAKSQEGMLQTQLIITGFIVFGLLLGTVQRHLAGDGFLAFIFFAFAALQTISLVQLVKAYKTMRRAKLLLKNMKSYGEMEDKQNV